MFGSTTRLSESAGRALVPKPSGSERRQRRTPLALGTIESGLRRAMQRKIPASLSAVAEELNTSARVLRKRCPGLSREVVARHAGEKKGLSLARHEKACGWVRSAVRACIMNNDFPSFRRVSECVGTLTLDRRYRKVYMDEMVRYGLYHRGREPSPVLNRLMLKAKDLVESEGTMEAV